MMAADVIASVLLLLGAGFVLLATIGLWSFDDLFSRIHAATKAITLGVLLVVAGTALRVHYPPDLLKLLLVAILQLISAPVAGHMLGRAAYWTGMDTNRQMVTDHLEGTDIGRAGHDS